MGKRLWSAEEIKDLIKKNDKVLMRGIVNIYSLQTEDEKKSETTSHNNGVGFNGVDAGFMSSLAEQIIKRGTLSDKQKVSARKVLVKYVKQLTAVANEDLVVKDLIPKGNPLYKESKRPDRVYVEDPAKVTKVDNDPMVNIYLIDDDVPMAEEPEEREEIEKEYKVVLRNGDGGKIGAKSLRAAAEWVKVSMERSKWLGANIREVGTVNQITLN